MGIRLMQWLLMHMRLVASFQGSEEQRQSTLGTPTHTITPRITHPSLNTSHNTHSNCTLTSPQRMHFNPSGIAGSGSGSGSGINLWGTGAGAEGDDEEFPSLRRTQGQGLGQGHTPTNQNHNLYGSSNGGSSGSGSSNSQYQSQGYNQGQSQGQRQGSSQDHYTINNDYTYTTTNRYPSQEVMIIDLAAREHSCIL